MSKLFKVFPQEISFSSSIPQFLYHKFEEYPNQQAWRIDELSTFLLAQISYNFIEK